MVTRKNSSNSSGKIIEEAKSSNDQFRGLAVDLGLLNLDLDPDPEILDRLTKVLDQLPSDVATGITKTMVEAAGITRRDPTVFLKKHNISKAEGRLLAALAEGYSLIQHAETLGISVNTARTHMRRLLDKTGASGQLDLLRMFLIDK